MRSSFQHASRLPVFAAGVLAFGLAAAPLAAQQGAAYKRDVPAALAKQAKVSEDSARKIAEGRVPNGTVQAVELEREKGTLIYSFELKVAGREGIEEVNVDAMSGRVAAVEHESPEAERKEAAGEAKHERAHAKSAKRATPKPAPADTAAKP